MIFKKVLKIFNKMRRPFHGVGIKSFPVKTHIPFVFYLKEPVSHKITHNIIAAGLKDYLVILDDQYGFRSDPSGYERFVCLRTEFSWKNLRKLWKNEFALLDDLMERTLSNVTFGCFIPIYDRSAEMEYFIPKYRNRFSNIVTIQHGSLGAPEKYFPFLSDFFIARSLQDARTALAYPMKKDQKLVVGGNIMTPYTTRGELHRKIVESFERRSILYAPGFHFLTNLKFLKSAYLSSGPTIDIFFKPHPSDRLVSVYRILLFLAKLLGKKIHIIQTLENEKFAFLVTESSSLIFELMREGTLPIVFDPDCKSFPEYVEPWLYRAISHKIDFKEAQNHYKKQKQRLIAYYFKYNYQNDTFDSSKEVYLQILQKIAFSGDVPGDRFPVFEKRTEAPENTDSGP